MRALAEIGHRDELGRATDEGVACRPGRRAAPHPAAGAQRIASAGPGDGSARGLRRDERRVVGVGTTAGLGPSPTPGPAHRSPTRECWRLAPAFAISDWTGVARSAGIGAMTAGRRRGILRPRDRRRRQPLPPTRGLPIGVQPAAGLVVRGDLHPGRRLGAPGHRHRAAVAERAAGLRGERRLDLPGDARALRSGVRVRARDRGQQRARVGVVRVREQLVGRGLLHDPAQVHHRDPVADVVDHRQVVRDEQVGQAVLAPGGLPAG